jgi:hypothetical protein
MKPRIKKDSVNVRIYDKLLQLHNFNTKKVNEHYKLTLLKIDLKAIN